MNIKLQDFVINYEGYLAKVSGIFPKSEGDKTLYIVHFTNHPEISGGGYFEDSIIPLTNIVRFLYV